MDGLLVLMVIAWGANYSLLKRAFEEVPPAAFNALRMGFSSLVFLVAIQRGAPAGRPIGGHAVVRFLHASTR